MDSPLMDKERVAQACEVGKGCACQGRGIEPIHQGEGRISGTSVLRLVAICERERFHLDRIEDGVAYVLCKDGHMRRFPLEMFDKEGVA